MSSPRRRRRAIHECEHDHDHAHRLFNCGSCGRQVCICSRCDRGNIYCPMCASIRRAESSRAAGCRYQATPQGAWNHAERQRKYRERLLEDVTHRGSEAIRDLPKEDVEQMLVVTAVTTAEVAIAPEDPQAPGPGDGAAGSGNDEPRAPRTLVIQHVVPWIEPPSEVEEEPCCDFCHRRCGVYSRLGFLQRR